MMRNFGVVEPGIYRSGRYTMRSLNAYCHEYAIRRMVDLRSNPTSLLAASTHCWKGAHRTGAAVALYRKIICQWEEDAIWQELDRYGFGCMDKHPELLKGVIL